GRSGGWIRCAWADRKRAMKALKARLALASDALARRLLSVVTCSLAAVCALAVCSDSASFLVSFPRSPRARTSTIRRSRRQSIDGKLAATSQAGGSVVEGVVVVVALEAVPIWIIM